MPVENLIAASEVGNDRNRRPLRCRRLVRQSQKGEPIVGAAVEESGQQVNSKTVDVIGAGPSGLMAAEVLAQGGAKVTIHDHMPAPARKFLLAGRGGLNLTHSEPLDAFLEQHENKS